MIQRECHTCDIILSSVSVRELRPFNDRVSRISHNATGRGDEAEGETAKDESTHGGDGGHGENYGLCTPFLRFACTERAPRILGAPNCCVHDSARAQHHWGGLDK